MSVESLMVHEVTLLTRSGETQSSSGEITPEYTGSDTTMYLQPNSGKEIEADHNTPIGDWLGMGLADLDWESTQRILYGEHIFDVVGGPRYEPNPRLDIISHVELDLQEIGNIEGGS